MHHVYIYIYIYIYTTLIIYIYIYIYITRLIDLMSRLFANDSRDQGSIPGRVILKTFKKSYKILPYLTLCTIRYISRVKLRNPGKGVAPS